MIIKPTLSLSIKNIYTLLIVAGAFLYATSIQYGQASLNSYEAGWIDRTVEYQQLDKIQNRSERTDQWHILHARDNLATQQLWFAFGNFVLMAALSFLFLLWGGAKCLFFYQPMEDKKMRFELELLEGKVKSVQVANRSLTKKLVDFIKR